MKYPYILFGLGILLLTIIPIPKYVELNDLVLIESITITCKDNQYYVVMKEILPKKEENGITKDYNEYVEDGIDLNDVIKKIEKKKPMYYKKAKITIKNCSNKEKLKNLLKKK